MNKHGVPPSVKYIQRLRALADKLECDHDWEDCGATLQCTYPGCGAVKAR